MSLIHDHALHALRHHLRGHVYDPGEPEYRTGGTYLNWLAEAGDDRVRAAFGPNHERLARVKAGWDPENVFRATGNVRPH
jgi:Berberine and berberine like